MERADLEPVANGMEPLDDDLVDDELREYSLEHEAFHYFEWKSFDELFEIIDGGGYLADQAAAYDGFRHPAETIELCALPAAVSNRDWQRFVRYCLVGANLRGIAEELAAPEILDVLARSGHVSLALDAAGQLTDPLERVRAMAVVASALKQILGTPETTAWVTSPDLDRDQMAHLVALMRQEIDAFPTPRDMVEADRHGDSLASAAQVLAPELAQYWDDWITVLTTWPAAADTVRMALAIGWSEAAGIDSADLWRVLGGVTSLWRYRHRLVLIIAGCRSALEYSAFRLRHLFAEPPADRYWWIIVAALSRLAESHPASSTAAWHRLVAEAQPAWSPALIETGGNLWSALGLEVLERISNEVDHPETRAALLVAMMERWPDSGRLDRALEALQALRDPEFRLGLCLKLLRAAGPVRRLWVQRMVDTLSRFLYEARYQAEARSLAMFFDLVARHRPQELRRQLENLSWSPAGTADNLRAVARHCREQPLLECLLEHAIALSAAVARDDAEGLELRRDLVTSVTCRLVSTTSDLRWLDQARSRVAPAEEDELVAAVACEAARSEHPEAAQLVAHISNNRLRLLTRLRTTRPGSLHKQLLQPAALYEAMADQRAVQDEMAALKCLLTLPTNLDEVAAQGAASIADADRRILAQVDLARHSLAYEQRAVKAEQRDPAAPISMLAEGLVGASGEEWAMGLLPELVTLGARLGHKQALAELQEAVLRLLRADKVSQAVREETLEALLVRLVEISNPDWRRDADPRYWRAVARFLSWLVELPGTEVDGSEVLRQRWHVILPMIAAALDRLHAGIRFFLRHPLAARLMLEHLGSLSVLLGRSRLETLWNLLDRHAPRRGAVRLLLGSMPDEELRIDEAWPWLSTQQRNMVRLCCSWTSDRPQALRELDECEKGALGIEETQACVRLVGREDPALAFRLLRSLPAGAERDATIRRLLELGWIIDETVAQQVASLIDPASAEALRAEMCLEGGKPEDRNDSWLQALTAMMRRAEPDPSAPANSDIRRRLWKSDDDHTATQLAATAAEALAIAGRQGGERVVRWWLQCHVAPQPGEASTEGQHRLRALIRAVEDSQSITAIDEPVEEDPAAKSDGQAKGGRSDPDPRRLGLLARWRKQRDSRGGLDLLESRGKAPAFLAFGSIGVLFVIDCRLRWPAEELGLAYRMLDAIPIPVLFGAAAAMCLVNALSMSSLVERVASSRVSFDLPWRWLIRLFAAVPLLGMAIVFLWKHWERHVGAAPGPGRPGPGFELAHRPRNHRTHRAWHRLTHSIATNSARHSATLWLFIANLVLLAAVLARVPAREGRWSMVCFWIVGGLVHLFATAMALGFIRERLRETWRNASDHRLVPLLALFWLVPIPYLGLVGLVVYGLLESRYASSRLVARLSAALGQEQRLPSWAALEKSIRLWREDQPLLDRIRTASGLSDRAPAEGESPYLRRAHYRLRCGLLLFEGAATSQALLIAGTAWPSFSRTVAVLLMLLTGGALLAGCLGVVGMLTRFVGALGRGAPGPGGRPAYSRCLAASQLTFAAGLLAGIFINAGNLASLGTLFLIFGVLGAMTVVLPTMLSSVDFMHSPIDENRNDWLVWVLVLLGLAITGLQVARAPTSESADFYLAFFELSAGLCVAAAPLVGRAFLARMTSPLSVADRLRPDLSPRQRCILRLMIVTVLAPLGGLAVPLWLYLRHRQWPGLVRTWADARESR